MLKALRPLSLALVSLCLAGLVRADTPPPAEAPPAATPRQVGPTTPPALASDAPITPAPMAPRSAARAVSPNIANMLAASMPSYNPPPPPTEAPESEDRDEPRNQIIRLPEMIVEGERPPVFTEREIHTKKGLAELAMSRYLSEVDRGVLNRFRLPVIGMSNEERALEQFREDERLRNMALTQEQIEVLRRTNPEEAARLQETAHDTFIRRGNLPPPTVLRRE